MDKLCEIDISVMIYVLAYIPDGHRKHLQVVFLGSCTNVPHFFLYV